MRPVVFQCGLDDNMVDLADECFTGFPHLRGLDPENRTFYDEPFLFREGLLDFINDFC